MTNIRNPFSYLKNLWDWTPYNQCFDSGIRITDVDGLVERHGNFLLIETKSVDVEIPKGQAILFDHICEDKRWNVLIVWGEPNKPRQWKLWNKEKMYYGGQRELIEFIAKWYRYANGS